MKCPKCSYDNEYYAKFCIQCGHEFQQERGESWFDHYSADDDGRTTPEPAFDTGKTDGIPSPPTPDDLVESKMRPGRAGKLSAKASPRRRSYPDHDQDQERKKKPDKIPKDKPPKPVRRPVSKKRAGAIIAPVLLIVILLLVIHWYPVPEASSESSKKLWDPGFDVESLITAGDRTFYEKYPQLPMLYSLSKRTLTQNADIIFEQPAVYSGGEDLPIFRNLGTRDYALNNWAISGAQVTPSIENLVERIYQDVSDNRVLKAKAIFDFVSNYLEYKIDGSYEFPVTTLLEREGQCSEYATLLASLYLAAGFQTYYVFTEMEASDYFQMYHIWVAIYLPEMTQVDSSQFIITSKLGDGWVGLDTTGNQCSFCELFSASDYHSNIVTIVEPITSLTIYDIKADWESESAGRGQAVHLKVYLKTWESSDPNEDTVGLTFRLYDHGSLKDSESFTLDENKYKTLDFELEYTRSYWKGETEQYITIEVR